MHLRGIVAFDEMRLVAISDEQGFELFVRDAREDGRIGDLVAVQMEDRQDRAVLTGLRNLFECQDVASGPVSASPSPTMTATIRSGIVECGAEACERL